MVLAHEMAHIRRDDHRVQPLVLLFRILYWWHPLAWITSRWLKHERERACDDLVLQGPVRPSDYAELLLEAATLARTGKDLPTVALAMAGMSGVEERVLSVLNPQLQRTPPTQALRWMVGLAGLGLLVIVGSTGVQAGEEKVMPTPAPAAIRLSSVKSEFVFLQIADDFYQSHKEEVDQWIDLKNGAEFFAQLNSTHLRKQVDSLSAPSVTTRDKQKFKITVPRDFPYPVSFDSEGPGPVTPSGFETKILGVAVEAEPTIQGDSILLNGKVEETCFLGFTTGDPGVQTPSFETREMRFLQKLESGQIRVVMATWVKTERPEENGVPREIKKRLLLMIQATLVEDGAVVMEKDNALLKKAFLSDVQFENAPLSEAIDSVINVLKEANTNQLPVKFHKNSTFPMPQFSLKVDKISAIDFLAEIEKQTGYGYTVMDHEFVFNNPQLTQELRRSKEPVKDTSTGLPYATPVPGKLGFATSPYAPDAGLVDLRGFAPGTPVKCPYTEKMFLAP